MTKLTDKCYLLGEAAEWDGADMVQLREVLVSVIEEFNRAIGESPSPDKDLYIMPDPNLGHPMCSNCGDQRIIYLSARHNRWSQYIYQFAHEYCHHLIDGPMDGELNTSFWFEETICETASLYFLVAISKRWELRKDTHPLLREFAYHNLTYVNDFVQRNGRIDAAIPEWINNNIETLSQPQYHRDLYARLAIELVDAFERNPSLWTIIPFLQRPSAEDYLSFEYFIKDIVRLRSENNSQVAYDDFRTLVVEE